MSLTICSGLPNMHPSFQFYPHLKILPVKKQGQPSDMSIQKGKETHPHTVQDMLLPSKRLRVSFPLACRGSTRTHWGVLSLRAKGCSPLSTRMAEWHGDVSAQGPARAMVLSGLCRAQLHMRSVRPVARPVGDVSGPVLAASCWERSRAAPDRREGTSPPNVLPKGLTVKCLSSDCADVMLKLWHGVSVIWRHT